MLEIGKRFDDQISEFQQSAHLMLQLLQRLGLLAVYGMMRMTSIAIAVRRMVAQMMMVVQRVRICGTHNHRCRWRSNNSASSSARCHQMRMMCDNAAATAAAQWQALHGAAGQFCDACVATTAAAVVAAVAVSVLANAAAVCFADAMRCG